MNLEIFIETSPRRKVNTCFKTLSLKKMICYKFLLVIQILTESFSVKACHSETIHCSYTV